MIPKTSTAPVREVESRVWVMSDLQTSNPDEARRCLTTAIEDFEGTDITFDQLWYLGDAVSGADVEQNRAVAAVQVEMLDDVGVPCRYVMGNHDIDPPRFAEVSEMPFYDLVRQHPNWRTTPTAEAFSFVDRVGDHTVLFLSDHVAPDIEWSVTHGRIHGREEAYPYDQDDYRAAIDDAAAPGRPLIVAGHNAFDGGNRPAALQRWFTPLPEETVIHLYGHAHVGDEKHIPYDSGRNAYRTLSYVDHHQVPQVDVASLEDRRGDVIRSAILETYGNGGCAVHIRDHSHRVWLESYHAYGPQRPHIVHLSSDRTTTTVSSITQRDQLVDVIEHLAAEHGLFETIPLPTHDEEANLVIAASPEHPDGSEMHQPQELSNGWYLEGRMGKPAKRRAIEEVVRACGLTVRFDGLWAGSGE